VGSGTVTIKKNFGGNLLYAVSKNNIIIDNIQINGNENTGYLMGLQTVGSITMNDIQTYHNSGTSIIFQG
jgi:archaellum component FlaF (FlaF/FlaG flagellin family)